MKTRLLTRFIALICAFTFLSESLLASPAINIETLSRLNSDKTLRTQNFSWLPENLGRVIEHSSESEPQVVLIQDAHGQLSAQKNTRLILDLIDSRKKISRLFIEGGVGELDPKQLLLSEDENQNQWFMRLLMRYAEIGGVEQFWLEKVMAGKKITAYGIEDPAVYSDNLKSFQEIQSHQKEIQENLQKKFLTLRTEASRQMPSALFSVFKEWLDYGFLSNQDFVAHMEIMRGLTRQFLKIDLQDPREQLSYPMLVRYFELQRRETRIQSPDLSKERELLFKKYGERLDNESARGRRFSRRNFWETFYQKYHPLGFEFKDYPALSIFEGAQILKEELDAVQLFEELSQLTFRVMESQASSDRDRQQILRAKQLIYSKKLLNLNLTLAEYKDVHHFPEDASIPFYQSALNFYKAALARDEVMIKGFLNYYSQQMNQRATLDVLVAGGFHTSGLTAKLKDLKIPYVVIQPRISELMENQNYIDSMLGKEPKWDISSSTLRNPHLATPLQNWKGYLPKVSLKRLLQIRDLGIRQSSKVLLPRARSEGRGEDAYSAWQEIRLEEDRLQQVIEFALFGNPEDRITFETTNPENLRRLLNLKKSEIVEILKKINELKRVVAVNEDYEIGQPMHTSLSAINAPDCGLCRDLADAVVSVFSKNERKAKFNPDRFELKNDYALIHAFAAIDSPSGRLAIDIAGGQIFFKEEGYFHTAPLLEYENFLKRRIEGEGISDDEVALIRARVREQDAAFEQRRRATFGGKLAHEVGSEARRDVIREIREIRDSAILRARAQYEKTQTRRMRNFQLPISEEHGDLLEQVRYVKKSGIAEKWPIVILNFDSHHDFYSGSDASATWARQLTSEGLAQTYTVLPVLGAGNQGGVGSQTLLPPRVITPAKDYRELSETERLTYPEVRDLRIRVHDWEGSTLKNREFTLQNYPGQIWISIDYDYFSIQQGFDYTGHHIETDKLKEQSVFLLNYLKTNGIYPDEILGYRSPHYIHSKKNPRWFAVMDAQIHEMRRAYFLPAGKASRKKLGLTVSGSGDSSNPSARSESRSHSIHEQMIAPLIYPRYILHAPETSLYGKELMFEAPVLKADAKDHAKIMFDIAVAFLKELSKKNDTVRRLTERLLSQSTVLAVDLPTIFYYPPDSIGMTHILQISMRRNAILISRKFLEHLDPNHPFSAKLASLYLLMGQQLLDKAEDVTDYFETEGHNRGLIVSGLQHVHRNVQDLLENPSPLLPAIIMDPLRFDPAHASLAALSSQDSQLRDAETKRLTVNEQALLQNYRQIQAILSGWDSVNGYGDEEIGTISRKIADIFPRSYREGGPTPQAAALWLLQRTIRSFQKRAYYFETQGESNKAVEYQIMAYHLYKAVQKIDFGGVLPLKTQEELVYFLMRTGQFSLFEKEWQNLINIHYVPYARRHSQSMIHEFSFPVWLLQSVPDLIYKLQYFRVQNDSKQNEIIERIEKTLLNAYFRQLSEAVNAQKRFAVDLLTDARDKSNGDLLIPVLETGDIFSFSWTRQRLSDVEHRVTIRAKRWLGSPDRTEAAGEIEFYLRKRDGVWIAAGPQPKNEEYSSIQVPRHIAKQYRLPQALLSLALKIAKQSNATAYKFYLPASLHELYQLKISSKSGRVGRKFVFEDLQNSSVAMVRMPTTSVRLRSESRDSEILLKQVSNSSGLITDGKFPSRSENRDDTEALDKSFFELLKRVRDAQSLSELTPLEKQLISHPLARANVILDENHLRENDVLALSVPEQLEGKLKAPLLWKFKGFDALGHPHLDSLNHSSQVRDKVQFPLLLDKFKQSVEGQHVLRLVKKRHPRLSLEDIRSNAPKGPVYFAGEAEAHLYGRYINQQFGGGEVAIDEIFALPSERYSIATDQTIPVSSEHFARTVRIGPLVLVTHPWKGLDSLADQLWTFNKKMKDLPQLSPYRGSIIPYTPSFYISLNAVQMRPVSAFEKNLLIEILKHREVFSGSTVVEWGGGNGLPSRIALGLGAKRVVYVEREETESKVAAYHFAAAGWKEALELNQEGNYTLLNMDFSRREFKEWSKRNKLSQQATVAIMNIGPWAFYEKGNHSALSQTVSWPSIKWIFNGGYLLSDPKDPEYKKHQAALTVAKKFLISKGFTVSESKLSGTVMLIAFRAESRLHDENDSQSQSNFKSRAVLRRQASTRLGRLFRSFRKPEVINNDTDFSALADIVENAWEGKRTILETAREMRFSFVWGLDPLRGFREPIALLEDILKWLESKKAEGAAALVFRIEKELKKDGNGYLFPLINAVTYRLFIMYPDLVSENFVKVWFDSMMRHKTGNISLPAWIDLQIPGLQQQRQTERMLHLFFTKNQEIQRFIFMRLTEHLTQGIDANWLALVFRKLMADADVDTKRKLIEQLPSFLKMPLNAAVYVAFASAFRDAIESDKELKTMFENKIEAVIFKGRRGRNKKRFVRYYDDSKARIHQKMPTFDEIYQDPLKMKRFLSILALLRQMYPYDLEDMSAKAGIERAEETGHVFSIRELRLVPVSESFRRHIIYSDFGPGPRFSIEIKISGDRPERNLIYYQHFYLAKKLWENYGAASGVVKPLFYVKYPPARGHYLYGKDIAQKSGGVLSIAAFEYQDGRRIENVFHATLAPFTHPSHAGKVIFEPTRYADDLVERFGITHAALMEDVAVDIIAAQIRIHRLGYLGFTEELFDSHIGNVKLIAETGRTEFVADFGAYQRTRITHDLAWRELTDMTLFLEKESRTAVYIKLLPKILKKLMDSAESKTEKRALLEQARFDLEPVLKTSSDAAALLDLELGELEHISGEVAPVRSEIRDAELPNASWAQGVREVAESLTGKILGIGSQFYTVLFPAVNQSVSSSLRSIMQNEADAYQSLFVRGGTAVIDSRILNQLNPELRENYFETLLWAAERSDNVSSRIYFVHDGDNLIKNAFFKSAYLREHPGLAEKVRRLFVFDARDFSALDSRLMKETPAISSVENNLQFFYSLIPGLWVETGELQSLDSVSKLRYVHHLTQLQLLTAEKFKGDFVFLGLYRESRESAMAQFLSAVGAQNPELDSQGMFKASVKWLASETFATSLATYVQLAQSA